MPDPITPPPHAYIPGQTDRHPEGLFDPIRDTAQPGKSAEELSRSDAFQAGLHYLETAYFWEAHEVLEPVWMALPEDSAERGFVQALIQFANAQLKLRMDRPKAALRLCEIVRELLSGETRATVMGVDVQGLQRQVDSFARKLDVAL